MIAAHLDAQRADDVVLTLAAIEALIGDRLPGTAYVDTGWWNNPGSYFARQYRAYGWRARVDPATGSVRFRRAEPAPTA